MKLPVLRIWGDRNLPLMEALLDLYVASPTVLDGLIEVIPNDGAPLCIEEIERRRPPYMQALREIAQFLKSNGYEDASAFLNTGISTKRSNDK